MNDFESTENSGLLKNVYVDSGLSETLKRKRKKLSETKFNIQPEEEEEERDKS